MKRTMLVAILVAFVLVSSQANAGRTIVVDIAGSGDFISIQAAIVDAGVTGDSIVVLPGRYYEAINFLGKAVWLYSSDGPDVTIIDATGFNSSAVTCASGEGRDTILDGFTVTGGSASSGGGMYNLNSSPTVMDCIFDSNQTSGQGGGMYNQGSSPAVLHCVFRNNLAGLNGGGLMNNVSSSPAVVNCLFIGNSSGTRGGGIANYLTSNPVVTNCTLFKNTAVNGGGGVYNYISSPAMVNCIVWGNGPDQILNSASTSPITYSNIQGGYTGTGNINADPLFLDAAGDDLRLSRGSPCIDAGNNSAVPAEITTDLGGRPRFLDDPCTRGIGGVVDMGVYEFMPADINRSGFVDFADFAALAEHWKGSGGSSAGVDLNCDGSVNFKDLAMLLEWWLI